MPLPFLIAAAVVGVGSVVGAAANAVNRDYEEELESINRKAEKLARVTEMNFKDAQRRTEESLVSLASLKKEIYNQTLTDFVNHFKKIKNVEVTNNTSLSEKIHKMEKFALDFNNNSKGYEYKTEREEAIKGAILGSLFGGAYLFGSVIKGVKLQYAIEEAEANYAKLKVEVEKVKKEETKLKLIRKRADEIYSVTYTLNGLFQLAIQEMKKNIATIGVDYRSYNQQQREQLFTTVQFADAIKKLLDVRITTPQGNVTPESKKVLDASNPLLESAK